MEVWRTSLKTTEHCHQVFGKLFFYPYFEQNGLPYSKPGGAYLDDSLGAGGERGTVLTGFSGSLIRETGKPILWGLWGHIGNFQLAHTLAVQRSTINSGANNRESKGTHISRSRGSALRCQGGPLG